jgi:hypothetical protein
MMGCTTKFTGHLSFTRELTASELAVVSSFFNEDCRDHPDWVSFGETLFYIDLKLTKDFSGIEWDGSEKTYFLDKLINVLITEVKKKIHDFGLSGSMDAQGEDIDDAWTLLINDEGFAENIKRVVIGVVECPECQHRFIRK